MPSLEFVCPHVMSTKLLKVQSPESLAKEYQDAPLKIKPQVDHLVGKLVIADPLDACKPLKNAEQVQGNIVILGDCKNYL